MTVKREISTCKHNLYGVNYPNDPKLFISCVRNSVTEDENETIMLKVRQGANLRNVMKRDLIFRKRRFPVLEILIYINLLRGISNCT